MWVDTLTCDCSETTLAIGMTSNKQYNRQQSALAAVIDMSGGNRHGQRQSTLAAAIGMTSGN
jgi:hypothetical protein